MIIPFNEIIRFEFIPKGAYWFIQIMENNQWEYLQHEVVMIGTWKTEVKYAQFKSKDEAIKWLKEKGII